MTPDVFISYSRENQQEVIKMVEYLRSQGVAVWMDESDIHGATMWTKEIVEAIRASSVFILAISRHSTGSKNVVKELALASEREKIILPIYLEQCEIPETMEYQLAGIQNIALYTLDKGKAYEFVHQTIRRLGVGQAQPEDQALGQARAAIFLLPMREKVAEGRMRVEAFFTKKRNGFRLAVSTLTLPSPSRERVFSVPTQKPSCASCASWLIQSTWPSAACLPEAITLACRHVIAGHYRGTDAPLGGGHVGVRQNRGRGHCPGRRDRGQARA